MSRASDAAKRNEQRGQVWHGGVKGARIKPGEAKMNVCRECGVYPCVGRDECKMAGARTRRVTLYKCPKCQKRSLKKRVIKRHQKWKKHY